ncbi:MAG: hypothetical protein GY913_15500 [Proteobacteria bacterium]|nr:hypothetical protein [Pseudomonadota bacterium]MCP4918314.1 hypothetical protein [Pseudomonadota bacterium]
MILLFLACADGIRLEDWLEPDLVLRTPSAGEHISGEIVQVSGIARHLDEIEVNGVPADVSLFGAFEVDVPVEHGMNVIEAVGFRDDGEIRFDRHAILAGTFDNPEDPVPGAITVRVNQGALDTAMLTVQDAIDPDEVTRQAMAMNPVYNDSYDIAGWSFVTVKAVIDSIHFRQPKLRATPIADQLLVELRIPAFHVACSSWGHVFERPFDVYVSVGADEVVVTPGLGMRDEDGRLKLSLESFEVQLNGFRFDTSLLPDSVEDLLLVDSVHDKLEGFLGNAGLTLLAPLIETALDGVDTSFEAQVGGHPLSAELAFSDALIDPDGIQIAMDMATHMPAALQTRAPGYLRSPATAEPQPSHAADVSVAVADDFLNALFFQMWRAGLLDLTLSTEDGSLDELLLMRLKADEGTIRARAELPPVIGEERGELAISLGEFVVDIDTPGGELGEHVSMAVDIDITAQVETADGQLQIDLGEPDLDLMVRESDWGATDEATTNLFEAMVPVDTVVGLLGQVEVPLPTVTDGPLDVRIVRDPGGSHTIVALDL